MFGTSGAGASRKQSSAVAFFPHSKITPVEQDICCATARACPVQMSLPKQHFCSLSTPLPSMQVPSLTTALSSGALNPTAAEFVPGGLSAAPASKATPASDQVRIPSPASGEASRPPKIASKVCSLPVRMEDSFPLFPSLRASVAA